MGEHVIVAAQTDTSQGASKDVASVVDSADSKVQIYVRARLEVWDTGTTQWVKMTQPGGSGGGGAVTVADGADVAEGATTDIAVQGDTAGTVSAKLRGLNKSIAAGIDIADRAGRIVGHVNVDNFPATQPISAAALPLPTGAATEATLLTRTKPADQQHVIVDTMTPALALDATVNGLLKPASTLAAVTSITNPVTANGDIDHDVANTLKNIQIAGNASPVDVPPAVVSANGDRVRAWLDRSGAIVVRRRKLRESYTAVFRLAEAAARLDQTFTHTANTDKQWATLHHLVGATKEVRLQLCVVWVTSMITVAPQGIIELRQINAAPVTGNPAITPTPHRRGGTAAEAVCLYLPTTAGTEANVDRPLGHHVFDEAVSVATVGFAHPQGYQRGGIVLYDASLEDDEVMPPVLPVATLDGWAVVSRLTGATVMRATVMMKFTEEIP